VQARGQAERLEILDLRGDQAERGAERLTLEEDVDSEAGHAGDGVGDVDRAPLLEELVLLGRHDPVEQLLRLVRVEGRQVVDPFELASDPDDRGHADGHVQVGGIPLRHLREQVVERVRDFHALPRSGYRQSQTPS